MCMYVCMYIFGRPYGCLCMLDLHGCHVAYSMRPCVCVLCCAVQILPASATMLCRYALPLCSATMLCHYALLLCCATMICHYAAPLCCAELASVCHEAGTVLLVDEAHGAHLGLHPDLPPRCAVCSLQLPVQAYSPRIAVAS